MTMPAERPRASAFRHNWLVLDTNVLLVANGQHAEVSAACVRRCQRVLRRVQQRGGVVIDDSWRLLEEYQNKLGSQGEGPGSRFLRWLIEHSGDPALVQQVRITELYPDCWAEFRDQSLQDRFDAPDRKFVAVAAAHTGLPIIVQASDSKWLDWWPALLQQGIRVAFLCRRDLRRFHAGKFPEQPPPQLPPDYL